MKGLRKEQEKLESAPKAASPRAPAVAQPDAPTVTPITKRQEKVEASRDTDNDSLLEEATAEALIRRLDEQRRILHQRA